MNDFGHKQEWWARRSLHTQIIELKFIGHAKPNSMLIDVYHGYFQSIYTLAFNNQLKKLSKIFEVLLKMITIYHINFGQQYECFEKYTPQILSRIFYKQSDIGQKMDLVETKAFILKYIQENQKQFKHNQKITKYSQLRNIINRQIDFLKLQLFQLSPNYFLQNQTNVFFPATLQQLERNQHAFKVYLISSIENIQSIIFLSGQQKIKQLQLFQKRHSKYFNCELIKDGEDFGLRFKQCDQYSKTIRNFGQLIGQGRFGKLTNKTIVNYLIKQLKEYHNSTKCYYPLLIATSISFDHAQPQKIYLSSSNPILFALGLYKQPKTVQLKLLSTFNPMLEEEDKKYLNIPDFYNNEWIFQLQNLLNIKQNHFDSQGIDLKLQQNYVWRMLCILSQIYKKENILITMGKLKKLDRIKLSQEIQKMKSQIRNDSKSLYNLIPQSYLNLQNKSFNFKVQELEKIIGFSKDDFSVNEQFKFIKTKKLYKMRMHILKEIISFLTVSKYFQKMFNAKKYILIFYLTSVEILFQYAGLLAWQLRNKGWHLKFKLVIKKPFNDLNQKEGTNYLLLAYQKIFDDYLKRNDGQTRYLNSNQQMLTSMAAIYKKCTLLRNKYRQYNQITFNSRKQQFNQTQATLLSQMKQIILQSYSTNIQALKSFADKELIQKEKDIHEFHRVVNQNPQSKIYAYLNKKLVVYIKTYLRLNLAHAVFIEASILPQLSDKNIQQSGQKIKEERIYKKYIINKLQILQQIDDRLQKIDINNKIQEYQFIKQKNDLIAKRFIVQ